MGTPFSPAQLADAIKAYEAEAAEIRADAERRARKAEARAVLFREMLAELTPSAKDQGALPLGNQTEPVTDIRSFLTEIVNDGRPHELHEMVSAARQAGLLKDSNFPGRSVHAVLMGMIQSGLVKRENDRWVREKAKG